MAEILRGELGRIRLSSLLQVVEGELLDASLSLTGGSVKFRYGQVVKAELGALQRGLAVLELFWFRGPFVLEDWQGEGEPLAPTMTLVMEGSRLLDEWSRLSRAYLVPVEGRECAGMDALVPLLDGRRTLEEIVAAAGLSKAMATDRCCSWLEEGALKQLSRPVAPPITTEPSPVVPAPTAAAPKVVAAPGPAAPAISAANYAEAMDAGRRLLREGRLTDAEAAFGIALQFSPQDPVARQNLRWVAQVRARTLTNSMGK